MKNVKGKILGRKVLSFILTATLVLGLMPGNMMTVSAEGTDTVISDELIVESVSSNDVSATTECTCGTDDPAFHATNCPAYIAPENPQCTCAEKCTEDTLNVWCDVCGMQGVSVCQGEDTAVTYDAATPDFSAAKVLTVVDGTPCIDGVAITDRTLPAGDYKLESDITTNIHVFTEGSINIDLNGHTWNMSDKNLRIDNNVTLSLYDTSGEGTGKITSSYMQTVYVVGSGSTFNLYSGTVENTSNEVNARGVSSDYGSSNLYGGTIKSNAYAVFYYLGQNITINIDNTSFDCGAGYAQISATLTLNNEPCAVIDVSDYTGGALTVDAKTYEAGKIKIFTGIQSTQDPENYTVNVSFNDYDDFFKEKEEYEEDGGNKYVYVSVPSFTTQPTEENGYTVAFNHPEATLQWCEVTVIKSATYTKEDGHPVVVYEVNAGDALIVSLSECSDGFNVIFDCSYNEESSSMHLDSSRKTASVTFDSEGTVDVNCMPSPYGTGEYKIEHVRYTELEGENGFQLGKTECETTYVCKATVGEREYCSDEVTIEQGHSYTCTATSDNVITKECANCGKSGTLTITAEGGVYDGTTAYGATVIKTGILENEEVIVNYYQDDTWMGTDAPVNAGTYTAKITYEEVTASVTYKINTTPTADMFTYIESAVYDGTAKSANVVVKDGITGVGEIANTKYYQNGTEVTPVNAGIYTVKIDVAEGDNYDAATDIEVGTFEITKATPTLHMFTATPSSDLVYDGTEKSIIVTTDKVGMGTFTVSYVSITDSTQPVQPVDAGLYVVLLHIEEGDNYIADDTLSFVSFEIRKADSVITAAPTPIADLVYGGTALNLINAGTATGGEMQYSLDGTNYSSAIPTGTDAGEYTVWYKVVGDKNHNDTTPASIEVSIAPKSITVTADNASKTYGEADPKFTYTATGLEGSDTLTGTLSCETGENAGTYAITQGTLANPNYEITFVEGTFTINKATPPALTIPTATTITYGEKLSASTLSDSSWAWVDGTIVPNVSDYYNAYIEVDDSNYDYTGVDGYDDVNHRVVKGVVVIITRETLTITANSYTIKVGSALPTYEYTVTGLVNGDTLPFDVSLSCSATDSNTVGTYPITISGVASDALASLYAPIYVNGTLTISEKDIQEITADDVTLTYGETGKKIAATTSGDGAISYSTTSDVISVAADGTITALKAGTATVTITAAETADYAEETKTISVTVNKVGAEVTAAPTPIADLEYDGTAQNLINAGTTTDGEMQYSLDGTNYSPTIPTSTDAGEYTVWYKVVGDENHNDTTPASIEVTIAPKTLEINSVTAIDRAFDGTNTVEISAIIIDGVIDADNVSASATAAIDSINAGVYSKVDLSGITLTGDAASNYSIAASAENVSLTTPVTISKADAPTLLRGSKAYVYSIGYEGESVSITGLPTDCGEVEYSLLSVSSDMFENISVDRSSGKITYDVKALDSYTEDLQGTISVNVKMDNYENAFYALDITRRDKYAVTVKDGMSVSLKTNELIYGQRLGELAFNEVTFVGEAGEVVDGTLEWEDSNEVPDVATDKASWRFIPGSEAYKEVVGTLDITVHRAPLVVEAVPVVADRVYNPSVTLADVALSGGTVKDEYGKTIEGTWSWEDSDTVPTVGNAGYEAVFTPVDANYETVTGTIRVKVNQATPVITQVNGTTITYGDSLAASTVSGQAKHSASVDMAVAGSFSWKDTTVKPAVADSDTTAFEVVFTPADSVNYKAVETTAKITVNKAPVAPNKPESSLSVPYTTGTVGETDLPAGWTWQNGETALEVGVVCNAVAVYTGTDAGNYETESVTVAITRADGLAQNISAEDIGLTYGDDGATISVEGANTSLSYEVVEDSEINGNVVTVDSDGKVYVENAGTATIRITASSSDTYAEAECEILVTVAKRPVTITAESYIVKEGNALPKFAYKVVGLVDDDILPITVSVTCTADDTEAVGKFDIEVGGPTAAGNYTYTYEKGVLEVLAKDEAPHIYGNGGKMGWEVISDEMDGTAKGSTVTVDMNGAVVVPGDIIEQAREQGLVLSLVMDNGLIWTIDGDSVVAGEIGNISFATTIESGENPLNNIPVEVINRVTDEVATVEVNLAYSGEFGFTAVLTADLGSSNAGYYANLFYYNPTTGKLEYMCADVIATNGEANLIFTHASDYVIVIDDEDLGKKDSDSDQSGGSGNSGSAGGSGSTGSSGNAGGSGNSGSAATQPAGDNPVKSPQTGDALMIYLWMIMMFSALGMTGVACYKKKYKK